MMFSTEEADSHVFPAIRKASQQHKTIFPQLWIGEQGKRKKKKKINQTIFVLL